MTSFYLKKKTPKSVDLLKMFLYHLSLKRKQILRKNFYKINGNKSKTKQITPVENIAHEFICGTVLIIKAPY